MKKILSPKITGAGAERLAAKLRGLLAAEPEIAALGGQLTIYEAWALSDDQVKARAEVRLPDGSYKLLRRVVNFPLPPELRTAYRDWTIIVRPTWYGFGYQLLDETGAAVSESVEDLANAAFALENAQREVNRLLAERATISGTSNDYPNRSRKTQRR